MAFNMFPYSNFHDLNLDWMLNELKDFSGQLDEFRTRLDTIREGILTEANGYIKQSYGNIPRSTHIPRTCTIPDVLQYNFP